MLICPECQSENPNSNRFCQHCGSSLVQTNCHGCGAEMSLTTLSCEICGTANARELVALIATNVKKAPQLELASSIISSNQHGEIAKDSSPESDQEWQIKDNYLDQQQRYFLPSKSEQNIALGEIVPADVFVVQTKVVDKFPLKESYFDQLKKEKPLLFDDLSKGIDRLYILDPREDEDEVFPALALPYFSLQHYTPAIPAIYDCWPNGDYSVLLLADRSDWVLLSEIWSKQSSHSTQILWYLNEILKYWHPLVKAGCTQTLMIKENLLLDEDESFGFQRIYLDAPEYEPSLKELAIKWHEWLSDSPQNYAEGLARTIQRVIDQEIETVQEFREELCALADSKEALEEIDETTGWEESREDLFTFEEDGIDSLFHPEQTEDMLTATFSMEIADLKEAVVTDNGRQRDHNEDYYGIKTSVKHLETPDKRSVNIKGLHIVCDGMGGHSAGEVASAMAVDTLTTYFDEHWQDQLPEEETIREGILLANKTIYESNLENNSSGNGMMGTTLVMSLLQNTSCAIAHIGDSRIYSVTQSRGLEQLTQDHEVGQREINRGVEPEIAYGRPDAYQLTQALGPRGNRFIKPAIEFFDIDEDCLILLCSDGLSDNDFLETTWQTYLQPLMNNNTNLQSGLYDLIEMANQHNGHDNITGILLRIKLQPNFEV